MRRGVINTICDDSGTSTHLFRETGVNFDFSDGKKYEHPFVASAIEASKLSLTCLKQSIDTETIEYQVMQSVQAIEKLFCLSEDIDYRSGYSIALPLTQEYLSTYLQQDFIYYVHQLFLLRFPHKLPKAGNWDFLLQPETWKEGMKIVFFIQKNMDGQFRLHDIVYSSGDQEGGAQEYVGKIEMA